METKTMPSTLCHDLKVYYDEIGPKNYNVDLSLYLQEKDDYCWGRTPLNNTYYPELTFYRLGFEKFLKYLLDLLETKV